MERTLLLNTIYAILKNVNTSLKTITKSLSDLQKTREYIIKNMREIIIICSNAITLAHDKKLKLAKRKVEIAKKLLIKYRSKTKNGLSRYMITAEQEFVEADSLLSIIEGKEIKSHEQLNVYHDSYILGLLDCIGELKRFTYDKIRSGDSVEAMKIFNIMEELYSALYPLTIYDKIIKEMRRKMDVDRILIEDARSAITEEIRRSELIKSIIEIKSD